MEFTDKFSLLSRRVQSNAIREMIRLTRGKKVISFAGGLPSPEVFPTAEMQPVIAGLLQASPPSALQYGLTQGCKELLEQIGAYLHSRGLRRSQPENLLVTSGAQQALDLLARLLLGPGDVILVELPTYIGAAAAFRNLGADLIGIRQDGEGFVLDELAETLARLRRRGRKAAFLYTVPNFSNPSGVLMSQRRRTALLQLAAEWDILIVEDDAYGELYFGDCDAEAIRPISAADGEGRVIYVGTFSKTIAPGIRTGWACAAPEIISRLELLKQGADLFTSTLNQRIAAELLARGFFDAHLPKLRAYYERKRDVLTAALEAEMSGFARWNRPRGGFFVWLELLPELDAVSLLPSAIEAGVVYIPGQPFHADGSGSHTIRLAFSSESEENIRSGIATLAQFVPPAVHATPSAIMPPPRRLR
ncbi:MAG: PLP-dependent aminotransferase family protein [Acidobacteria bacterium]|nr:PLP-dependent aminotransferase family protein [Acidobacteriota bacterium]